MNESDEGLRFEVDVFTGKGFLVFVLFFVRRKEKEREGGKGGRERFIAWFGLHFRVTEKNGRKKKSKLNNTNTIEESGYTFSGKRKCGKKIINVFSRESPVACRYTVRGKVFSFRIFFVNICIVLEVFKLVHITQTLTVKFI